MGDEEAAVSRYNSRCRKIGHLWNKQLPSKSVCMRCFVVRLKVDGKLQYVWPPLGQMKLEWDGRLP